MWLNHKAINKRFSRIVHLDLGKMIITFFGRPCIKEDADLFMDRLLQPICLQGRQEICEVE